MPIGGSVAGFRVGVPPVVYNGPGDVVSGANNWWGLRAYNAAAIGNNAIRLRRDSDNAEQNIATVSGGGLDSSAITTFKGAANLFVVKLYDQTASANDLTQSTAANQPQFLLSVLGSLPGIFFVRASSLYLVGSVHSLSQPYTTSTVTQRTGSFTSRQNVLAY